MAGVADADLASSRDFGTAPPSHDNLPVPAGDKDLRDRSISRSKPRHRSKSRPYESQKPVVSDAEALFQEPTVRKQKSTGAEARAQARRCVSCGGSSRRACRSALPVVSTRTPACASASMMISSRRPPRAATSPPLHITIIGFLCGLTSLLLLVLSLIESVRGQAGSTQYGWLCLALVSAFGIYGAVQFFIGRWSKYLMLAALALGVFVDAMSLIALPIYEATFADQEAIVVRVNKKDNPHSLDDEVVQIKPITDRLDWQRIGGGLIVILLYALLSIYLMSPPVRDFIRQTATLDSVPIV